MNDRAPIPQIPLPFDVPNQPAKKFYFLEYFYVLLKSIEHSARLDKAFEHFLELKQQYRLGESRYKKLTVDTELSSRAARVKFEYTYERVLDEAEEYGLIRRVPGNTATITEAGREGIRVFEQDGYVQFNRSMLRLMEGKYEAFRYLVTSCYEANPERSGLLIFPIYSAHRLGIERESLRTSEDLRGYFKLLKQRLTVDIERFLGVQKDLSEHNDILLKSLEDAGLISANLNSPFDPKRYNVILKRGRDFWLKYFLRDLYKYPASLTTFDTWAYRGKQIGVIHITEFYPDPGFSGRIVYPLSVITLGQNRPTYFEAYKYPDGKRLLLHSPSWNDTRVQEEFIKYLHQAYVDLKLIARTYFVNLLSVRERVCYNLKIPEYMFDEFLGYAFLRQEAMKIRISLEVDRLPDETKVMYLRREPVVVAGQYRNIIAIDIV